MIEKIYKDIKFSMNKCVDNFKNYVNKVHINNLSTDIINNIKIKHCNKFVPLYTIASVNLEDSNTVNISVFDKKNISIIEKSIRSANLSFSIFSKKKSIYLKMLPLNQENKKRIVKLICIEAEQKKVSIRNIRRDANNRFKILLRNKSISENENFIFQNKIQECTDFYIKSIDNILNNKKNSLMKI